MLSGATTNTPSLGAAQQALTTLPDFPADRAELPALAYAVSYPIGIIGIIGSMVVLRAIFRIDSVQEAEQFRTEQQRGIEPLERINLLVENRSLDSLPLGQIPGFQETGVTVSRVRPTGAVEAQRATAGVIIHVGDVLLAVGTQRGLERFSRIVGSVTDEDLTKSPGSVSSRRLVVTRKSVIGKTVAELGLRHLYGVNVTAHQQGRSGDDRGAQLAAAIRRCHPGRRRAR